MNRMDILKNPGMDPKFCPVIPRSVEGIPVINSALISFNSEEWPQFFNRLRIVSAEKTAYDTLQQFYLASIFSKIEIESLNVGYVFMNPKDFTVVRRWDLGYVEIETQASTIRQYNVVAHIYGADIVVSRKVPMGLILACSDDGTVGATLELGQETFKEARKLVELEKSIQELSANLNAKYRQMIEIIHNTIDKIENKDNH